MIKIAELNKKSIGRYVLYSSKGGDKIEVGRIKSWNDKFVFVVYKCNEEWERFMDFTGAPTKPEDLLFTNKKIINQLTHPLMIADVSFGDDAFRDILKITK